MALRRRTGLLGSVSAWAPGGAVVVAAALALLGGGDDAALRRGVIVIQHRRDLPEAVVEELRTLQEVVPPGTIVTPGRVASEDAVAVLAWHGLLTCRRHSPGAVDAIRLFRGRFIGSGPDRPG